MRNLSALGALMDWLYSGLGSSRCLVFTLFTCLSGCILPLAPEFEDPDPNLSPYLVSAIPAVGEIVRENEDIRVIVADPNLGDELYLWWAFNYPPNTNISHLVDEIIPAPGGGKPERRLNPITPTCGKELVPGLSFHRVMLVVSDRKFLPPGDTNLFDQVPKDGFALRIVWNIQKVCPQ